jgi:hypothetical protein
MKFTKEYSKVSVSQPPEKRKKPVSGVGAFTSIKRALDKIAERVGSTVGVDQSRTRVTFYLNQRPKTRQGRLNWNKEVDRLSTLCGERLARYSPGVIVGRTGYQLELRPRRRHG